MKECKKYVEPKRSDDMVVKNDKLTENQKKINAKKLLNLIKTKVA